MVYRCYFRTIDSERWIPVMLGARPRDFAMHSDAVEEQLKVKEKKTFNGRLIMDTMIVSIDKLILKSDDGDQIVTLMELC